MNVPLVHRHIVIVKMFDRKRVELPKKNPEKVGREHYYGQTLVRSIICTNTVIN